MSDDPIPASVAIGALSANIFVTADALESAEMLVEFAIPKVELLAQTTFSPSTPT